MISTFNDIYKQIEENNQASEDSLQRIQELAKTKTFILTNFKNEIRSIISKLNSIEIVDIIEDITYTVEMENVVDERSAATLGFIKEFNNLSYDELRELNEFMQEMNKGHGLNYIRKNMENYLALSIFMPVFVNHILDMLKEKVTQSTEYETSIILLMKEITKEIETYYEDSKVKDLLKTF